MDNQVPTYDPKKCSLIVAGVPVVGFADQELIEFNMLDDLFVPRVGVKGQVSRTRRANPGATITVHLDQTSSSNDQFSALMNADYHGGGSTFPVLFRDGSGTTSISSLGCYFTKWPNAGFGKEQKERTWIIHLPQPKVFIGGSTHE